MWLPAPLYERLPQFWFLLGLLFVAYALYVGLDISTSMGYVVAGLVCCLIGVGVAVLRAKHRRDRTAKNKSKDGDQPLAF